jgi:hypothetical protein
MEGRGLAGSRASKTQLLQYVDATTLVCSEAKSRERSRSRPHTGIPSQ